MISVYQVISCGRIADSLLWDLLMISGFVVFCSGLVSIGVPWTLSICVSWIPTRACRDLGPVWTCMDPGLGIIGMLDLHPLKALLRFDSIFKSPLQAYIRGIDCWVIFVANVLFRGAISELFVLQIMMLHGGVLMGGRLDMSDRYRGWRLDIDSMSYEVRNSCIW